MFCDVKCGIVKEIEKFEFSPLLYVRDYKATRVDRWRNLQPCVGDCKAGLIPRRHTKIMEA